MIWIFNIAVVIAFAVVVANFLKTRKAHLELLSEYSRQVTRADKAVIDRDVYENRYKEEHEKRTELETTLNNNTKKLESLTAEHKKLKTQLVEIKKQLESPVEAAPVETEKTAKKTTTRRTARKTTTKKAE